MACPGVVHHYLSPLKSPASQKIHRGSLCSPVWRTKTGGIRSPKEVVTPSEHTTNKTSTELPQNDITGTFTELPVEQNQTDSSQDCNTTLHQKCALCVHHSDTDLQEINRIWPELSERIKALIQTYIRESK